MSSLPNFSFPPPPDPAQMGSDGQGNATYVPNPQFRQWLAQMYNWTKVFGNNASSAIGGFQIGNDYIRDVADSFGLSSTVTGGDDVRFWAGDTFANRATAPMHIFESGKAAFSNILVTGGSVIASSTQVSSGISAAIAGIVSGASNAGILGNSANYFGVMGISGDSSYAGISGQNTAGGDAIFCNGKFHSTGNTQLDGNVLFGGIMRPLSVNGYLASDSSPGISGFVTTTLLVGKILTFTDGLITGFA